MNIRKLLAGSMAAITAGATIAFGAFAQSSNLGAYVDTSGSTPVPPWVVIGANTGDPAFANDVLGAADLAAGVAGFVTVNKAIGGAAEIAVSGGVSLSTANTKLYGGDSINKAKATLTSEDLPSILASGTFEDSDGNTYDYDQYIVVGSSTITMSTSNDDDRLGEDPVPLIDIGTSYSSPAYTLKIIFNDDLNFSDSDVGSNAIELFGTSYTISSDSDTDTLVLFGGANKQTLSEGETATVEVGGVSYEVSLIGVSDENTVIVKVNDESRTIDEGNSRKVSGLEVFVDEVYFLQKETQVSSARLSFGSSKLTINDDDEVSVGSGSDEDDIDNTHVTFTQGSTGTSVIQIAIAAPDSDGDFAAVGMPFVDPVFGTFKLAYGGGSPDVSAAVADGDSTSDVELFNFETTGDDTATLKMTDSRGNTKTVEWGFDSSKSSTSNTLTLADGDNDAIIVVEGGPDTIGTANEDDYIVINQGDFSHLLEVTDINTDTGDGSDGQVKVKDVFSGTVYEVSMTEGASGYFNGTKVIDGYEYVFWSHDATPKQLKIVWGENAVALAAAASATNPDPGDVTSVFPTLVAAKDAEIAFLNNISVGTDHADETWEIMGISVTLSATDAATEIDGTSINYTYGNSTDGYITIESVAGPAVAVLEEEGKDYLDNDKRNAVIVEAEQDDNGINLDENTPMFTDNVAQAAGFQSTSDSDVEVGVDRYGTFVSVDSNDQGTVDVFYPDTQVIQAAAIGSAPVFSVSGEAGTVQEAYKITSAVAKLASEVNTATLNRNLILVGGPCANSLVATLMDVSMTYPECAAPFEGLSDGMIKEYTDAFGSGKKALVVAGVVAEDTRALAVKVLQGTLSYEA